MNYISFPGLGIEFKINPVAFTIGSKNVYWYGIIIAIGVIMGSLVALKAAKRQNLPKDLIPDLLIYGLPSAIICGRLYYCIFEYTKYIENPIKIFAIWEGGIAIYGGIIGAIISTSIYCKVKKLSWKKVFDIGILGIITGQIIGRWGNFVNAEAHGGPTNLPWRMELYEDGALTAFHPTFLYESLWNLLGLILLTYINQHKKNDGTTFFSYLIWYGIGRALIESLRTDSLYFGAFRVSQLVGILTALTGIAYFIFLKYKNKKTL